MSVPTEYDGLPVYRSGATPEVLLTRSQLRAAGLSPATPVAWLHLSAPRVGSLLCPLFDRQTCRPKRPLTERQAAALAAGRALRWRRLYGCPRCDPEGRGEVCVDCREKAWLELVEASHAHAVNTARALISDPAARILDFETTDLGGHVVQAAVTDTAGTVLFESLVDPAAPISDEAAAIHGLTADTLAGAPRFADILQPLTSAIGWKARGGGPIVAYNAEFDRDVLRRELQRYEQQTGKHVRIGAGRWKCAMILRAEWEGALNEAGEPFFEPLNGGHDAVRDCQAVARLLAEMAADQRTEPSMNEQAPAVSQGLP